MRSLYFLPVLLLVGIIPVAFADITNLEVKLNTNEEMIEKEEIVYFSLEENPEVVKERVSDAFWENPMSTPPMLVLIALAGAGIFVAWRRKWHIHEPTSDMRK